MALPPRIQTPAARVVSDGGGHASHLHLRWLGVSLAAAAVVFLVQQLLYSRLWAKITASDFDDYDSIGNSFEVITIVTEPMLFVAAIAMVVFGYLTWRRSAPDALPVIAAAPFATAVVVAASTLVLVLGLFIDSRPSWLEWLLTITFRIGGLALIAVPTATLLVLGKRPQDRAPLITAAWVIAAVSILVWIFVAFGASFLPRDPWVSFAIRIPAVVGLLGLVALLCWRRGALSSIPPTYGATNRTARGHLWVPAANGLGLYARALLWRLVLTVGAYLALLLSIESQAFGFVKTLAWAIPMIALATGGAMTFGVFQYAKQPQGSRASGPALAAGTMMAISLLFDLVLFYAVIRLLTTDTSDWEALREASELMGSVQAMAVWGMALSFAAFAALLTSFYRLASDLGDRPLAARCISFGVLVIGSALVALVARLWIDGKDRIPKDTMLLAAGVVVIAALVAVIAYLMLVNRLQHRVADEVLRID